MTMIEPPYPKDLEAKGWSLDLEYERIARSNTWAIASAEQRPWLLMIWLMSWQQAPVASLPAEDRFIAAHIGMPIEQFTQWREVLLSGWELATDGRLYHKTLTEHVLKMASKRVKDTARVRAHRERLATNADVVSCNALHASDTRVTSAESRPVTTPPTNTDTKKEKNKPKKQLMTFSEWSEVNPDPDYGAVYRYAESINLPAELLNIAFFDFGEKYGDGGTNAAKKYKDWKLVFLQAIRENWLRVWFTEPDGSFRLTVRGQQAERSMQGRDKGGEA